MSKKIDSKSLERVKSVVQHLNGRKECSNICSNPCSSAAMGDIEDLGPACPRPCGVRHSGHHFDDDSEHLFDPKRFEETQKPLLEASTLPREVYNSEKWYQRELETVFFPSWTLVGRVDEVASPGSFLTIDTEWGGPVAVSRGHDGELHAFANVCCHRGAKVIQAPSGQASSVGHVCPYHAWTYDFDGRLKWAPGTDANVDFDDDSVRMPPLRVEVFHGFIFVCLSSEAPNLAKVMGDLPAKLPTWFGPDGAAQNMVCVARREYVVDCNWKFIMENTCETYHTSVVHKDSLGPMKSTPMEPHVGDWDAVQVPSVRTIVPLASDFEGEKEPLPAFTNSTAFVNLFPSLQINVTWDSMWWMYTAPTGPSQCKVTMGFCFPKATAQLPNFEEKLPHYLKRWHMAVCEDNAISLNQQRGVRSAFRTPGRFTQLEFGTHNFNNWLLSKVLVGESSKWDPGQRVFLGEGEMYSNDDKRLLEVVKEASERLSPALATASLAKATS